MRVKYPTGSEDHSLLYREAPREIIEDDPRRHYNTARSEARRVGQLLFEKIAHR